MRLNFLLSFLAVGLLVAACYLPWMTIESRGLTITGMHTEGTRFGQPGYFHFVWAGLYLFILLFNKIWSRRTAVVLAAFNGAWTLRNFFLIPACAGGECPVRGAGLYLLLIASIAMFFAPLVEKNAVGNHPSQ